MSKKEKKKIPWSHYFWIFLIASVLGTFYEEILHIIYHLYKYKEFDYSRRSGVFWGPVSPIYGFGALVFMLVFGRGEKSRLSIFIGCSLLGGLGEYIMSFIQEWTTGTRSWDYSDKFLNIQGRTTVIYMLAWGLAGLLLIKWLYPRLKKIFSRVKHSTYRVITSVLFFLVSFDLLVTWTAVGRSELKEKGIESYTPLGAFYDEHFDKEYIEKKIPNAKEK